MDQRTENGRKMAGQAQPWEKRDGEGPKPFEAFVMYRDLGAARSLAKVAERLGKSETLIARWSSNWGWVQRASAWDREDDRQFLNEQRAARKATARRHARVAVRMQSKLVQAIEILEPSTLKPSDLIRWLEITTKVEMAAVMVDLDTDAMIAAMNAGGGTGSSLAAGLDRLSDEDRRERMQALAREMENRLRAGREELEKAEEARREELGLDDAEDEDVKALGEIL